MQEGGGIEDRNRPIIDIIGSQAVAPVLPSGATFVGEGQTVQPLEFQQTPQITDAPAVSTPAIAHAPATQITPTTAPTFKTPVLALTTLLIFNCVWYASRVSFISFLSSVPNSIR